MKPTRILIVEDETIVALDIQDRVSDLGYKVAGVADRGDEALALVASTQPDLVLMDIRLKGRMDGIEAAEEIRQRWRIPVVFLTAFSEDSTLQRAKVTEPFGYLIKPFEDREIQAAIEMALYKHQAEQRLRESERRYATTLRSIGDGVIATDSQGRVTFMNPVAERLTGWSQSEANGRPLSEVFKIANEQTRVVAEDPVAKVMREMKAVGFANHTILIRRDGLEIPIDDCAAPIMDDLDQLIGTVLVFQDVTERRLKDAELRRIEWMLTPRPHPMAGRGAFLQLDRCEPASLDASRLILDSVGETLLRDIVSDYMDMLETAAVVYERNGDCSFGVSASGWCRFMGDPARKAGRIHCNERAHSGARGSCCDGCCEDVSRIGLDRASAVDVVCQGGMRFYAVPIHAGDEIVGCISVGYGDPPRDPGTLLELARKCSVSFDELHSQMAAYQTRPAFIIELAKRRLESSARLIGEIVHRRILEQRQQESERLAKESNKILQLVLDTIPVRLFWKDLNSIYLGCNRLFAWDAGRKSPQELIGEIDANLSWSEQAELYRRDDQEVMSSGNPRLNYEEPQTSPEGRRIWLRTSKVPLRDANDEIKGVLGTYEDITDRKHAEEALRESEERYRSLFNSINDAVFVHGIGADGSPGRIVEVNDIACERLGYTREELLQMRPTDVDAPEALAVLPAVLDRLRVKGHAVWEGVHVAKDGRRIPVEISDRLFELHSGTFGVATVRDITDRKQTEEENRCLRNYLVNVIDSMPSVLVGVDTNGCITQWNAVAQAKTRIGSEEAEGQPLEQVSPTLARHLGMAREAMRDGRVKVESRVADVVKGELRYEDVTVYPLTTNGIGGAVIRVDDVTERVRIEEMMIQSEKMLSVGGLAAGMAHEINNPLGVILQSAQNVLRRFSKDLPINARVAEDCGTALEHILKYVERREILTFLEDIRGSGERAAEIVSNMLNFSRMPADKGAPTDVPELLDKTVTLAGSDYDLKRRYDFRRIEIVREYEPGLPQVICQAGKIQQVFLNILRNGAEAMKDASDRGRPPRFILRVKREGTVVRVDIADNGTGMEEAVRKRVFEPFFTTKPPGIGTGLGLSVSYFIVTEEHGGSLSVESQPDVGTRFCLRLPVAGKA